MVHYDSVPAWVAALPFLGTAAVLGLSQLAANFVSAQFEEFVENEKNRAKVDDDVAREYLDLVFPSRLEGRELARRLELAIDTTQSAAVIVVPSTGLAVVYFAQRSSTLLLLLLVVPIVSGALTLLLARARPGTYRSLAWTVFGRYKERPISFITWLGIGLNLAAAVIAWSTAPDAAAVIHGVTH